MRLLNGNPVLLEFAREKFGRCWPKARASSRGAAEAQLRSLERRGLVKDAQTAHVYQCPDCGEWHVGHSSLAADKALVQNHPPPVELEGGIDA